MLTKVGTMMTCHHHPHYEENEYFWKPEQQLVECITNELKIHRATFLYLSIFPNIFKCYQNFSNLLLEELRLTTTNSRM
jgi:hypothetical protein